MRPLGFSPAKKRQVTKESKVTTPTPIVQPAPPPPPPPKPIIPMRQRIEVRDSTQSVLDHKRCKKIVELAAKVMREEKIEAIAATGHSGLILASILSNHLEIPLIAVRKAGEGSHDARRISALLEYGRTYRLCVLDDHIGGGGTLKHVITTVQDKLREQISPALIFLYNGGSQENLKNYQLMADRACKEINLPSIPVKGIGIQDYA